MSAFIALADQWPALVILVLGFAALAYSLQKISTYLEGGEDKLANQINQLLPQTQCGQCGYNGCLPYAKALARGDSLNKCVPGGQPLITALEAFLGTKESKPLAKASRPSFEGAYQVIADQCIGCTKCIKVCPVDAIIGAPGCLHVILEEECTGCALCVDPCPTLAIEPVPAFRFPHTHQKAQTKPQLIAKSGA